MTKHKIYQMPFHTVYPFYVEKAEKKGRSVEEVNEIICWLTGYTWKQATQMMEASVDFETFFTQAPHLNPNRIMITGSVCGVKIAEIEEPIMKEIRYLDKLIDELAKGKMMDKILRK